MKYAYLANNTIVDLVGNDPFKLFQEAYAALFVEVPDDVQNNWIFDGDSFKPPVQVEKTQAEIEDEIQQKLNSFAQEKGFDSIADACSYVNSTNEEWSAEARIAIKARDDMWAKFYANGEIVELSWYA